MGHICLREGSSDRRRVCDRVLPPGEGKMPSVKSNDSCLVAYEKDYVEFSGGS